MHTIPSVVALGLALPCIAPAATYRGGPDDATPQPPTELRAELRAKVVKRWSYVLPAEIWQDIEDAIDLPHLNGRGFTADKHPTSLKMALDTDGDGRTDTTVRGNEDFAVLEMALGEERTPYGIRLRAAGEIYEFACSSVLEARLGGSTVTLIDQDNDGDFTEFGVDAMAVGRNKAACYLSRVAMLEDGLHELRIEGNELIATPYQGPTGTLSLASGFEARARLDGVVVRNDAGDSFELGHARRGLEVPVGRYKIAGGRVSQGQETVSIRAGRMPAIEVTADGEASLEWGGPLVAEIDFTRQGGQVRIAPEDVRFYGSAGEEYYAFYPDGASPKFEVYSDRTRKALGSLRFEGC